MYKRIFKRIIDFCIALLALIFFSPIFIILIIILHFANKNAGIFFTQSRPGKNEYIFKVVKFKTMNDKRDNNGNLLSDSERLTRIGKFVRSTSLDELPQLINVLKGDMSLIGPRPLLVKYLTLYNINQKRRHVVRPGITGWAQINGRNAISWEQKFEFDIWYVDHMSVFLDIKILLMTIKKVFIREGINSETFVTMEEFKGSNL